MSLVFHFFGPRWTAYTESVDKETHLYINYNIYTNTGYIIYFVIYISLLRRPTGWMVRGWHSGGGEIFRKLPDQPWGPPRLVYNGYRVFPGGKTAEAWHWQPTPSSAEVKKEYCYTSTPLWVLGYVTVYLCLYLYISLLLLRVMRWRSGWGTALQNGRTRFRFPMASLEFFIDIILPAALCLWGRLSL
jgi:hypothetical protein